MNNDINLVSSQESSSLKEKKRLKTIRVAAVVSLVVVALSSVLIFLLYSSLSLSSIKKDQDSTLNSISFLHKKSAELAIINNRLLDITNILQKRKNYTKAIATIRGQMPAGVNIIELEINKDEVLMVANSSSLSSINTFLNNVIALAQKQQTVSKIFIESITVNEKTGSYSLSLRATLL